MTMLVLAALLLLACPSFYGISGGAGGSAPVFVSAAAGAAEADVESMKVVQLRRELRLRGLDRKGTQAELVARLQEHDKTIAAAGTAEAAAALLRPIHQQAPRAAAPPRETEGPCNPHPCGPFGLCTALPAGVPVPHSCVCSRDWYGIHCNQSRAVADQLAQVRRRVQQQQQQEEEERQLAALAAEAATTLAKAQSELSRLRVAVWLATARSKKLLPGHTLRYTMDAAAEAGTGRGEDDAERTLCGATPPRAGRFEIALPNGAIAASFVANDILRISPSLSSSLATNIPQGGQQVSIWLAPLGESALQLLPRFRAEREKHSLGIVFNRGRASAAPWLDLLAALLLGDPQGRIAGFDFRSPRAQGRRTHHTAAADAEQRAAEEEEWRAERAFLAAAMEVQERRDAATKEAELAVERSEHQLKTRLQQAVRRYGSGDWRRAERENTNNAHKNNNNNNKNNNDNNKHNNNKHNNNKHNNNKHNNNN